MTEQERIRDDDGQDTSTIYDSLIGAVPLAGASRR